VCGEQLLSRLLTATRIPRTQKHERILVLGKNGVHDREADPLVAAGDE
jgi:hypothetical protein